MTTSPAVTAHHHHHHHHHNNKVSQTCNLLSQYLKENGSVRDINLVLSSPKPQGFTTKNLLHKIKKSGEMIDLNQLPPSEDGRAKMTIFYNGQVMVFNEFSQEKAKEIMDLASTITTTCGGMFRKSSGMTSSVISLTNGLMSSQPLCEGDMPIMRNASLTRFIAKRKDRIRARAPYHINMQWRHLARV